MKRGCLALSLAISAAISGAVQADVNSGLPHSAKLALNQNYVQWMHVRNSCSTTAWADFNGDTRLDYVTLITHRSGGAAVAFLSEKNGYRQMVLESLTAADAKQQRVDILKKGQSVVLGNPAAATPRKIQSPEDVLVRGQCQGSDDEYLAWNKSVFMDMAEKYPAKPRRPTRIADPKPPSTGTPSASVSGSCVIRQDFSIEPGKNESIKEFPLPAAGSPFRIDFTIHNADKSKFFGGITVYAYNKAAGFNNSKRELVSGGLNPSFSGPGQWEFNGRQQGRWVEEDVSMGTFMRSDTLPVGNSFDTLSVYMSQGVAVGGGAVVNAEIRVIGGSCGGTP